MIRRLGSWILGLGLVLSLPAMAEGPPESDAGEPRAKTQVERVLNAGLPFAERMLEQTGEFAPFGAVMLPKGLIQTLNPDHGPESTSEQILRSLITGLRKGTQKGDYKAVGVFAMVEMRRPDDDGTFSAVHVALEHLEGYCVDVYYPVVLRGDGLALDEPVAGKRSGTFFNTCQ